ncbi:shikimate dehydrogenase [Planctobacterium marinum]|uniref:Shikimate dehydrogenase (NADP(+)) n=1 Tax=Planctobacterium marinum TaxID=1631968 RepID=A0AA48KQL0_9ALTE|nr:shikimate dehydrogenase (NADP(+)) [Planctobacterium marinum]
MKKFVVFGNPIAHSRSPEIHRMFAQQFGEQLSYERQLSTESDFAKDVGALQQEGFIGCNVTLPFKELAFQLADEVSQRARIAGAANTLSLFRDKIVADNTDGQGLVGDLQLSVDLAAKHVLLLGAGGAARGCIYPLLQAGVEKISIWNRTREKVASLANELCAYGNVVAVSNLELAATKANIVVNSTSSSVNGSVPDIAPEVFGDAELVYDMFYQQSKTSFLEFAEKQNNEALLKDGLGMLVGQAAESYRIWHGQQPDINSVVDVLRKS